VLHLPTAVHYFSIEVLYENKSILLFDASHAKYFLKPTFINNFYAKTLCQSAVYTTNHYNH